MILNKVLFYFVISGSFPQPPSTYMMKFKNDQKLQHLTAKDLIHTLKKHEIKSTLKSRFYRSDATSFLLLLTTY